MAESRRKRTKKWIQRAVRRPGRLHRYLGIPEDEPIPLEKLYAILNDPNASRSIKAAARLAIRFKRGDLARARQRKSRGRRRKSR